MVMFEFTICSAIQGHHVYKVIWENPIIGEELKCQREIGNSHDPLAVAVVKQMDGLDTIVGHVSQRISASCNALSGDVVLFSAPLLVVEGTTLI